MMERVPAKTLADIEIAEGVYSPDFAIVDRYQAFSAELARLSLVGVAGYGFLISQLASKQPDTFGTVLRSQTSVLMFGVTFLGLALALALRHRFASTQCLYDQVTILRSLQRLASDQWTDDEKTAERLFLERVRHKQHQAAKLCHYGLMAGGLALTVGFVAVVVAFYRVLSAVA